MVMFFVLSGVLALGNAGTLLRDLLCALPEVCCNANPQN